MNGSFYIGFAPKLKERLAKHNAGLVQSTKRFLPVELIYFEGYKSKQDALIREQRLKRFAKGFASLKGRLRFSLMREG